VELSEAMDRALGLAKRGQGRVEPNPMVGAVLLRDGHIVGQGYHERFGGPHAEINALADAAARGEDVRGLTMCVTLEPCGHHGKTPPCAEALIQAGVGRVVVAMVDPYEKVAGRGAAMLRDAGIAVEVGVGEAQAQHLNEPFIKRVATGLPWVIAKWAQTLDGKTATAAGHSQWISNPQSRAMVHRLRSRVDAIMVGVGTVIADNPSLTARPGESPPPPEVSPESSGGDAKERSGGSSGGGGEGGGSFFENAPTSPPPISDKPAIQRLARRLVVDRSGRMPSDAKMLHDNGPPVTILAGELRSELKQLASEGVTNVLVEGGATLVGALLREQLVDQLLVFSAPKLVGDAKAIPAARGLECATMADALALELRDVQRLGDDVLLDYRVKH